MLILATVKQSSKQPIGSDDSDAGDNDDVGYAATTEKPKLKKPPLYKVILVNDDYTPMEFVVWILQKVFYMSQTESEHVMMKIHQTGQASCGSYTYDVAQTKIVWVHQLAEKHQHPLQCQLKEAISDEH